MSVSRRTLSYLIFRSAFIGQMFAIVSLSLILLFSFVVSGTRERNQICEKAKLAWSSNQEKILELLTLDEKKGTVTKLQQVLEEGGWTKVRIEPEPGNSTFKAVTVGSKQSLAHVCRDEFSYLGQTHGFYEFEYPLRSFWSESIKLVGALLVALSGLFFIVFLQRKVIRRNILEPIGEIRKNLRSLSADSPTISFSKKAMCDELRDLQASIELAFTQNRKLHDNLENKKVSDEINRVSMQVAHDIRSPLASLDMILEDLRQLPEDKRVQIRNAVSRIRDIANTLLTKTRESSQLKVQEPELVSSTSEAVSLQLVSPLLDTLVSEKRLQYRNRIAIKIDFHLESSSYGLFIRTQPNELKIILSNIINNSVEAIRERGDVNITVSATPLHITINVVDNGKGIPSDILPKLGEQGQTYGKEAGLGLGLFHARSRTESWGGKMEITSELGKGTRVSLIIPRATAPEWFVPRLEINPFSTVVVLDDDSSVHAVWKSRLHYLLAQKSGLKLVHLTNPSEFRSWISENGQGLQPILYLVDYELAGYSETGLDLICSYNIQQDAILVTSHSEEKPLLEKCHFQKVRLIPKAMAGFVPISLRERKVGYSQS